MYNYEVENTPKGDVSNVKTSITEINDEIDVSEESLFDVLYSTPDDNINNKIYKSNDNNEYSLATAFNDHPENQSSNTINEEGNNSLFTFNSNDIFNEKSMFGLSEILTASEEHAPVMSTNYLEYIANSDPRVCFEMLHLGALLAIEKKEKISFTSESELPRWNLPEVKIEESRALRHDVELQKSTSSHESHKAYREKEQQQPIPFIDTKNRRLIPTEMNREINSNGCNSREGCFVVPLLQLAISNRAPLEREEAAIDNLLTNPPCHELARVIGPNLLATLKRNTLHPLQGVLPSSSPPLSQTAKAEEVADSQFERSRRSKRQRDYLFTL